MKKELFGVAALLLTAMMFTGCALASDNGGGGGDGGNVDKTALVTTIADAEAARAGVRHTGGTKADAPVGMFWVPQTAWNTFDGLISSARAANNNDGATQAQVNGAKTALVYGIPAFNAKRETGTGAALDISALSAKIAEAEDAKLGVVVDTAAVNVPQTSKWVTQAVMTTFDTAITVAKTVQNIATDQTVVNNAASTLGSAITTFTNAKQTGSKATDFSLAQLTALITAATTLQNSVTAAVNGDNIAPNAYWVSGSLREALANAIDAAKLITEAGAALDSAYTALTTAISNVNTSKALGASTSDVKTALTNAIKAADDAKKDVLTAASADAAALDSKWAKPEQWTPLNTAYDAALPVLNNPSATKTAVAAATNTLTGATSTFSGAVSGNGLGTLQPNRVKITGFTADLNGKGIQLGLFVNPDVAIDSIPSIFAEGAIAGGEAELTLGLYDGTGPWTGSGAYYVAFILETDAAYVSKTAKNFAPGTTVTLALATDFYSSENSGEYSTIYSVKVGDLFGLSFAGSKTLDALCQEKGYANYTTVVEQYRGGIGFYKDPDITQLYSGSDGVTADTKVYSTIPIEIYWDGPIGLISGTVTLTNIPQTGLQAVYITAIVNDDRAFEEAYTPWQASGNGEVNLSSEKSFSMPLYSYGNNKSFPGSGTISFQLNVMFEDGTNYDVYVSGTKPINGSALNPTTPINVGNIGTANIGLITLSGTITLSYTTTPSEVYISPVTWPGSFRSQPLAINKDQQNWEVQVSVFSLTELTSGLDIHISYTFGGSLYRDRCTTLDSVPTTDTAGIALGTVALTDYDNIDP
jgi:hypothetical protein